MIHSASVLPVDRAREQPALLLQLPVHLVVDRLRLARVATGREDEEVRVDAHGPHVEDDDVFSQLLGGESGDPACLFEGAQSTHCSSETRSSGVVGRDRARRCTRRPRGRRGRRSARRAATRSRISVDETGCGSSSKTSIRSEVALGRANRAGSRRRGARARARARAPSTSGRRRARRRRSGRSDRRSRLPRARRRCSVLLELDRRGEPGEREPRHREPVLGRRLGRLVGGVGDDGDVQLVEAEVLDRGSGEREVAEVRRVERCRRRSLLPLRAPRRRSRRPGPCGRPRPSGPPRAPRPSARRR